MKYPKYFHASLGAIIESAPPNLKSEILDPPMDCILLLASLPPRDRLGRDLNVVGFTITYAIGAYHH